MDTRVRHRPQLVHIVKYKKTGHYFIVISATQTLNLDSIIKRVHDAEAMGPKRSVINWPLKDFADTHAPVVPADFEVTTMNGTFDTSKEAAKVATALAQLELGTKLLLSTQVVERADWEAYAPAKERVIRRQFERANVANLSAPTQILAWFSDFKRSTTETGFVTCKKMVSGSLVMWAGMEAVTLLTHDIPGQSEKCVAAEKIVMVSVYLELVFKDTRRFHSGNVVKSVKFGHFAPSLLIAMSELKEYLTELQRTHTGDTEYPEFKGWPWS